jgi:hypothetical protein
MPAQLSPEAARVFRLLDSHQWKLTILADLTVQLRCRGCGIDYAVSADYIIKTYPFEGGRYGG